MIVDLPHGARINTDTMGAEELVSLAAQLVTEGNKGRPGASDTRKCWRAVKRLTSALAKRGKLTLDGQLSFPF
jgi:hypothetical protein